METGSVDLFGPWVPLALQLLPEPQIPVAGLAGPGFTAKTEGYGGHSTTAQDTEYASPPRPTILN